jgi:hypothetical protein
MPTNLPRPGTPANRPHPQKTQKTNSLVLDKLRVLEARYAALAAAARSKGGALNQDAVALNLVLSLLFTAVTRVSWCGGEGDALAARGSWSQTARLPQPLPSLLQPTPPPQHQLRRMVMLLPEALGADQPFASAPVLAHFEAEQAGEGGAGDWNFASLTQVGGGNHGQRFFFWGGGRAGGWQHCRGR